jgi:S1-C subfamily serine protease
MEQGASGGSALAALSNALAEAVEAAARSVVRVEARRRQAASGIVWSEDGLIVTADHVLERDEDLAVGLPDGRRVSAAVVGRDPSSDLAVLRAQATGLTPLARGASARVGALGIIVARPGDGPMASFGSVNAITGPIRSRRRGRIEGLIVTDASFFPGFSGAPFVGADGQALGLATSRFGGGSGSGLIIPVSIVERVATALIGHGKVRRGFLGLSSQPVAIPEALRTRAGLGDQEVGLMVVGVEPGGPAEQAGLTLGDVLVALGGEPVRDTGELRDLLGPDRVGEATTVRVIRGGAPLDLAVTIGERP